MLTLPDDLAPPKLVYQAPNPQGSGHPRPALLVTPLGDGQSRTDRCYVVWHNRRIDRSPSCAAPSGADRDSFIHLVCRPCFDWRALN